MDDKDKAPRSSKLTPELQAAICECLRLGMPLVYACKSVGISTQTLRRWRKAGKQYDDPLYVDFVSAMKKAAADFVNDNMGWIRDAARDKSWQAAAWLLERRLPEYYALKQIAEVADLKAEMAEVKAALNSRKEAAP